MTALPSFILGVILIASTQAQEEQTHTPVDSMCAVVRCSSNSYCRVVQKCAGPACSPEVQCIRCVEKGVDDVCNANRYIYAVLVSTKSLLSERKCDPALPGGSPNCPDGSVCVADGSGRGTCCYGKPDPAPENGESVTNGNPVCQVDKCGGCRPGFECKAHQVMCVRAPCPPIYRCEKRGRCPYLPMSMARGCPDIAKKCDNDSECPGRQKCCKDWCNNMTCRDAEKSGWHGAGVFS